MIFLAVEVVVCYTAVFSVVTQRSSPLVRDDTKNGCVADYENTEMENIWLCNILTS